MGLQTGEILALAGMVVLLLSNLGHRRARQGKLPARVGLARMLSWGDYVALGLIVAGLLVIYIQK